MTIFDDVLQLYTAYFNRAADTAGVNYWLDKVETNNWTIDQIAQSFADQKEYQDLYANKSNAQVVEAVYNNLLNRQPDSDGLVYWANELDNGTMQVENLVLAVTTAATQVDQDNIPVHPEDKSIVDKKVEISKYYYDHNNEDITISLSEVTTDTVLDQFVSPEDDIVIDDLNININSDGTTIADDNISEVFIIDSSSTYAHTIEGFDPSSDKITFGLDITSSDILIYNRYDDSQAMFEYSPDGGNTIIDITITGLTTQEDEVLTTSQGLEAILA